MQKELFRIESVNSENDGNFRAVARMHAEHEIFKGHFPELPVLPGVCLLYLIRICAEKHLKQQLHYVVVEACKFSSIVDPLRTEELRLHVETKPNAKGIKIKAVVHYGPRLVLKTQAIVRSIPA